MTHKKILFNPASSIAASKKGRILSNCRIVERHISKIEEAYPVFNAVVLLATDQAVRKATKSDKALGDREGLYPLHRVPITEKGSPDTGGIISAEAPIALTSSQKVTKGSPTGESTT